MKKQDKPYLKIRKRILERVQYYVKCPICNEEIRGGSKTHTLKNLNIHIISKHPEESKKHKKDKRGYGSSY